MINRIISSTALLLLPLGSYAELYDRGSGMIYDDVLDITWLQDANYAATQYIATDGMNGDADGMMTWSEANTWAANLNYGGYDDWRLPSVGDSPEVGYEGSSGELSYMFFMNLGNQSNQVVNCYPDCLQNTSFNNAGSGPATSQFINAQTWAYWYAEEYAGYTPAAWNFNTFFGAQKWSGKYQRLYAWAVRDGDVYIPTPNDLIRSLIDDVIALNLKRGISNALDHKLETILKTLEDSNANNNASIFNLIYTFVYSVEAQREKQISDEQADALITAAYEIIDRLELQ